MSWSEIPRSPGHAFYDRLQAELVAAGFGGFVERLCAAHDAARRVGRGRGGGDRQWVGFNGQSVVAGTAGNNSISTSSVTAKLGVSATNGNSFDGRMSELILVRDIPTEGERADAYNAMAAFYGV